MAENFTPQNQQDDELSVEELEGAAGGMAAVTNNGCPNTNCAESCGTSPEFGGSVGGQV